MLLGVRNRVLVDGPRSRLGHVVAGRGALNPTPICLSMSEMNKMSMGCHWTGEVLSHTRTAAVCLRKRCLLDPQMLWVPFSQWTCEGGHSASTPSIEGPSYLPMTCR